MRKLDPKAAGNKTPGIRSRQSKLPSKQLHANLQSLSLPVTSTVPGPASISELARSLKHDVDLIYEWVYSNVDYYPLWNSNKGALATLIDRVGGPFDQAGLMLALLVESGYSARFVYGTVRLTAEQIQNLLGTEDSSAFFPTPSVNMLETGLIPNTPTYDGSGELLYIDIRHVWVQVTISGTDYVFDPTFKTYNYSTGVDVGSITGFDLPTLVSEAEDGATVTADYIQNLNTANIRTQFTEYGTNLLDWIRTNAFDASMKDIIGGRGIEPLQPGSVVRQTYLSNQTPGSTTDIWAAIPDSYRTTYRVQCGGLDHTFFSDEICGRRLTITFNASLEPELRLNGTLIQTGSAQSPDVDITATFTAAPFTAPWTQSIYTDTQGTYLLGNTHGPTSQSMVDYHRQILLQNMANGGGDSDEAVLGESLYVLFLTHCSQGSKFEEIMGQLGLCTFFRFTFSGIAGYNSSKQTPYFDLAGINMTTVSTVGDADKAFQAYAANLVVIGGFEAGIMQQTFPYTGVATGRMLDTGNDLSQKLFVASSDNWISTVRGQLVNWDALLTKFDSLISNSYSLVIHEDGDTSVGSFAGGGWYQVKGNLIGSELTGSILGGNPSQPVPPGLVNGDSSKARGKGGTNTGNSGAGSAPGSDEPVNLCSGAYYYDKLDMSVGSGEFPYSLQFARSYSSDTRFSDGPLGLGWTHNLATNIATSSNGLRGCGEVSPKEAAAAIGVAYALIQLELGNNFPSPSLMNYLIASTSVMWLMDGFTNNALVLSDVAQSRTFIKLVDGTYNPAPGYADTLVQNVDDTFTLKNPQQEAWNFDVDGLLTSYVSPAGVTRTYSYDDGKLSSVSTGMGRTLTFTYSGDRLESVSDGNGRSVSFTVDASGNLVAFTDAEGKTINYEYAFPGQLTKIFLPANPTVPIVTNTFDSLGRVKTQQGADTGIFAYYFSGRRSEEVDALGNSRVMYFNPIGTLLLNIDALGEQTAYTQDGLNRLVEIIYPELNSVAFEYDDNNNVLTKTWVAKPGSGLADIVQTFTYDPLWNKVQTATDGRGFTTSYEYDPTQGTLLSITRPEVNGQTPVVTFIYNDRGQVLSRTDETDIVDSFGYDSTTEVLLSAIRDSGSGRLNLLTTFEYDDIGNVIGVTDPRGYTTTFEFDNERRRIQRQETAPFSFITKFNFDDNGWLTSIQRQTSDPANPWQTFSYTWRPSGQLQLITDPANRSFKLTYDKVGRLVVKTDAERRAWKFAYDEVNRVTAVTDPAGVLAEVRAYTPNGRLFTTQDANANVTTFEWDGFDRLSKQAYPDTSFEEYTFDENSNVLVRVTRNGDSVTTSYDPLNRVATQEPTGLALRTLTFDLAGRLTKMSTPVVGGDPTTGDYEFSFDTAGRLVQQTTPAGQSIDYELDENGNRTKLTWPDTYFAQYVFDELNRLTDIKLNGSTDAAAHFAYDALSRRIGLDYGNDCTSSYSYWANDDMSLLAHNFVGSDVSFALGYNAVHQVTNQLVSDDTFVWNPLASSLTVYGPANNLNEYPDVMEPFEYDANGCLTSDGVNAYSYDSLTRLIEVARTGLTNSYLYDPFNRQARKVVDDTVTPVTANYLYDLGEIIADFDGSGTLQNRYVRGLRSDELLVTVSSSDLLTYSHQDRIGSIIGTTDEEGAVTNKYRYSPFGETADLTGSIFGFTGQKYDAEFALYDFKARYYSAQIGRFLQPDPIGYLAGDLNLYTYVNNDPANLTDPSGMTAVTEQFGQILQRVLQLFQGPNPSPGQGGREMLPVPPPVLNGSGTGPAGPKPGGTAGAAGSPIAIPGVFANSPEGNAPKPGDPDFIGPVNQNSPPPPPPPQGVYDPINPGEPGAAGPTVYPERPIGLTPKGPITNPTYVENARPKLDKEFGLPGEPGTAPDWTGEHDDMPGGRKF